jgi:predicted nucleic acid-binding protein
LLRTEAIRALHWAGHDAYVGAARRLFSAMQLVRADEPLLDRAGELDPRELRSLDAVHLATALALGADLGVVITYDQRLGEAAREQGLVVHSPS